MDAKVTRAHDTPWYAPMMRKSVFVAVICVGCGAAQSGEQAGAPTIDHGVAARGKGPIVVGVVVDQLAAWMAEERWPELPSTGGFARLKREGVYERDVRYAHAVTDTAPGHSALYTGRPPRDSGIFANDVVDDDSGKSHGVLRDDKTKLVTVDGLTDIVGVSLQRLDVPTLADNFRAARADADIVTISLKDRGAIFGGGRTPSAALWFDSKLDAFVTSTAFATSLPAWAKEHASNAWLVRMRAEPWTPTDGTWLSKHSLTPDAQLGEGDESGYGTTFPHLVSASQRPSAAFRASPYADAAVARLALDAIAAHDETKPMMLALSFSANDTIAHMFSPDSWESWDNLRRLDGELAALFTALDAKVGAEGWSLALTGDHGASTLPEAADVARPWCRTTRATKDTWERPCGPLGRIVGDTLADSLETEAKKSLGKAAPKSRIVLGVADPYVYLTSETSKLPKADRDKVVAAVRAAALASPGVDRVASYVAGPCATGESIDALVCRSLSSKNADALFLVPKPGWFFDAGYVVGKGSSHGAPYLYNRAVPLLVRSPRHVQAGLTEVNPRPFTAFTSTMAAMLNIRAFPVPPEDSLIH